MASYVMPSQTGKQRFLTFDIAAFSSPMENGGHLAGKEAGGTVRNT